MMFRIAFAVLAVFCFKTAFSSKDTRPSVIFYGEDWTDQSLIVRCERSSGNLFSAYVSRRNLAEDFKGTTKWSKVPLPPNVKCNSNPGLLLQANNSTYISFQSSSGQVYLNFITEDSKFGDWIIVGGKLEYNEGAPVRGLDSLSIHDFEGHLYVFARSYCNSSHLYWSSFDKEKHTSSQWVMLGGNTKLGTDASVAFNSFTKLLEAFMVGTDGYLYRSWQISFAKWSSWDRTGYFAPQTKHAPVVHEMDTNMFNGRLNVFIHGNDGKLHHIWQTTCDKVHNPWGWCTWSTWNTIGSSMPNTDSSVTNTLSIGNNIHLGIEVFIVDSKGQMYKLWQMKRHGSWSDWQLVQGTQHYQVASLPAIVNDGTGWWSAYTLDSSDNVLIVQQNRSFNLSPPSVVTGSKLTVSWNMPADEASNRDWIAILPNGASNHFYIDFVYVGGTQNPRSDVIPSGEVSFTTYLPKGQYNVRYLVDKRYVAAIGTTLSVTKGPTDESWVQVFRGLFTGLNIKGVDINKCVKDAEKIPEDFMKAFKQFEDREIFTGISTLGTVLHDVMNATKDCGIEKEFVSRVLTYAKDMKDCIDQKDCTRFVVDLGKEILVLYENIYEIYGDIIGASNSFKINAFTQGGVNVGRVIAACIALPRDAVITAKPSVFVW